MNIFEEVKAGCVGRWTEVVEAVTGTEVPPVGHGIPCRKCNGDGGTNRFNRHSDFEETGAVLCRHCKPSTGDGIGTVAWLNDCSMIEAATAIAERFSIPVNNGHKSNGHSPKPKPKQPAGQQPTTMSRQLGVGNAPVWNKPGIEPEAIRAAGGSITEHRGEWCIEFAATHDGADGPISGFYYARQDGQPFEGGQKSLNKTAPGSSACNGWLVAGRGPDGNYVRGSEAILKCHTVWRTEGPPDIGALLSRLPAGHAVISGISPSGDSNLPMGLLAGKKVFAFTDNDDAGREQVRGFAAAAFEVAETVTVIDFDPTGEKLPKGFDVRDFFVKGFDFEQLMAVVEANGVLVDPKAEPPKLKAGELVRPADRGNVGRVVEDRGDSVLVEFHGKDGSAEREFQKGELRRMDGSPLVTGGVANDDGRPDFRKSIIDMADFCQNEIQEEWVVENVMVAGEEVIFGGPGKSLKTACLADLAVSVATGGYYLDNEAFRVPEPRKVLFLTCETGRKTLQSLIKRICRSKMVETSALRGMLFYGYDLPTIANDEDVVRLSEYIENRDERGADVVIIDPAYLCLFDETTSIQAGNILQMGPLLRRLTKIRQQTGVTVVLAHHTRKMPPIKFGGKFYQTTREDLSQAGFGEFARQWQLLSRRREYQHNGRHELHLEIGGSAGHSSEHVLEVNEGKHDSSLNDWQVTLTPAREFEEAANAGKKERTEAKRDETLGRYADKVLKFLREQEPGTQLSKSAIGNATALNGGNAERALFELKRRGKVIMDDSKPNRIQWSLNPESDNPEPDNPDN